MASEQFARLLDDHWEFLVREDPLFATYTGDHRFNDRLPHVGEADASRQLQELRAFQRRLQAIARESLSAAEQLNYDILARTLENAIKEIEFRAYRLPICKTDGFHIQFPELPQQFIPLNNRQDYENYIARLRAFRQYAAEHIEVMRAGLREGQIPPRATLDGVEAQLKAQIVEDPTQSVLYKPFERFPKTIQDKDQQRLAVAGREAIAESVVPGYRDLMRFLQEEYLPGARESIAAADLPNGRAFYQHRIRYYTSLDLTPEAVHRTGLSEVSRIREEMEAVLRQVSFQGTIRQFADWLRKEPRFYAESAEALLKEVAFVLKRMDGELPRLFGRLPRMPYGIRPVPEFSAPSSTTAYYLPPAGDGTRAGMYYVNTYDLKSRPLYEVEALSLHEAVPGHHLQIALQQELALPKFRRFGGFTAFVEGWALYAERLGLGLGFYEDPYSNFGRLSYEMWRACRLVVDTGIHALGWTRQQAIDFMADNTSSTLLNIANEVDRYIAWPGQALAYKIGELKISELRRRAEQALGERFDLRAFHDVVLGNGAVPLDVLEGIVNAWVSAQSYKTGG